MPDTAEKIVSLSNLSRFKDKIDALKQDTLVSGTNIKTINSTSLLGSGDIQLATKAEYLKSLYHLGSYDSVDTSNADYDVVTRGTGYYYPERETSWNTAVGDGERYFWNALPNGVANAVVKNTAIPIYYSGSNIYFYPNDTSVALNIDSVGEWIAYCSANNIEIQYQLSSTHTEKVLKNKPISTLDQNGENWLRGEYERGLNLIHGAFTDGRAYSGAGDTYSDGNAKCILLEIEPNTKYALNNGAYAWINEYDFTKTFLRQKTASGTFTTSSDCAYVGLTYPIDTNAMLNYGSTAFPYHPHNANRHISNEEAELLKGEHEKTLNLWNASPSWSNSNTDTDSSFYSCVYVKGVLKGEERQASDGFKYITFTTPDEANLYFSWKHNGQERDLFIIENGYVGLEPNKTYTLSYQLNGHYPSSVGGLSISNIVLSEGDTPKPFVDWNGPIMHEINVKGVLLWENGNPNASFGNLTISISSIAPYRELVLYVKRVNGSDYTHQAFRFKKLSNGYVFTIFADDGTSEMQISSRAFHFSSDTSLDVYHGIVNNVVNDNMNIPVAIYGIK